MDTENSPNATVTDTATATSNSPTNANANAMPSTRVRVKKWNAVAFWAYDIDTDTCAICHNQLMLSCISCEAEPMHSDECTIAWGHCSHSYHFHCISRWLKTRSTCPLDDQEWDFMQY